MPDLLPLSVENLRVKRAGAVLLDIGKLVIAQGEHVALVGPNGAGKSLLIRAITALVSEGASGAVLWGGSPPNNSVMQRCGVVMQQPLMLRRSVIANLRFVLGRQLHGKALSEGVSHALELSQLSDKADRSARVLSGGERMRLAIARALVLKPDILLLDEPTASLDHSSARHVEQLIGNAADTDRTLVLISHDLALTRRLCTRTVLMHQGRVVADAATSTFFNRPPNASASAFVRGDYLE